MAAFLAAAGIDAAALAPGPEVLPPPAVLAALEAIADADRRHAPTAPVAFEVGQILFGLCRALRARRVLELGTGNGAAALWLGAALAATGGRLVTVERDSALASQARRQVRAAGLEKWVSVFLGDAARFLAREARARSGGQSESRARQERRGAASSRSPGPTTGDRGRGSRWDLVLLDEAPEEREDHLLALLPQLVAPGALLLSHGGRRYPVELARLNAGLRSHPAVAATLTLAVGEGLDMAVVRPKARRPSAAPGTAHP